MKTANVKAQDQLIIRLLDNDLSAKLINQFKIAFLIDQFLNRK